MSAVIQRNTQEVTEIATSMGLIAILPEPNEIQIDLDGKGAAVNQRILQILSDNGLHIDSPIVTTRKNGNKHVHAKVSRDLTMEQRLVLQACLGSDPVREVLSLIRLMSGSDAPTALFESVGQAARVKAWRKKEKAIQDIQF